MKNVKLPIPTEHDEQVAVVQYCRAKYGPFSIFAIPNASKMSFKAANWEKQAGRSKGVPDLFVPGKFGRYLGLFIELKRREGGVVSPEQHEWIVALLDCGYEAVVCEGADEAIGVIDKYLGTPF